MLNHVRRSFSGQILDAEIVEEKEDVSLAANLFLVDLIAGIRAVDTVTDPQADEIARIAAGNLEQLGHIFKLTRIILHLGLSSGLENIMQAGIKPWAPQRPILGHRIGFRYQKERPSVLPGPSPWWRGNVAGRFESDQPDPEVRCHRNGDGD